MYRHLIERIAANERVTAATWSRIVELIGDDRLDAAIIEGPDGVVRTLPARAVYALPGAEPCTDWLPHAIERDHRGFVLTGEQGQQQRTSLTRAAAATRTCVARDQRPGLPRPQ